MNNRALDLSYLNRAAEIIRKEKGMISMDELAGKAYISARQLEREFRKKIGISPKNYMRLSRLNEVNRILTSRSAVGVDRCLLRMWLFRSSTLYPGLQALYRAKSEKIHQRKKQYIVNPNTFKRKEN